MPAFSVSQKISGMDPVKKRISDAIDRDSTKSRKGLAEFLGRSPSMVTDLLSGDRQLKADELGKIEEYLGVRMDGQTTSVRLMGYVGTGAVIDPDHEQVPPDGLDTIDLPHPVPDYLIAFGVKGESMLPKYEDGDAILVYADQRFSTDTYVGEPAAVRIEGKRYLKEIQFGKKRGTFDLVSYNAKPIKNVAISWVGEIYSVIPAAQIRRHVRERRAQATRRARVRAQETAGMDELPLTPEETAKKLFGHRRKLAI